MGLKAWWKSLDDPKPGKPCRHSWVETTAFSQDYTDSTSKHCARGFECNLCGSRKVEKTEDFKRYYDVNPYNWQKILNWANEVPKRADIVQLNMVKK